MNDDASVPVGPSDPSPSDGEQSQLQNLLTNTSGSSKVTFGARRGVFDLTKEQVENFFHLVDQRISEQHACSAEICEFQVYYDDGASRLFRSLGDFQGYHETIYRVPTIVTIHFAYLISFPESQFPERQEIDITIRTSASATESLRPTMNESSARLSGDKIHFVVEDDRSGYGIIQFTISHSRVSWGLDMENHIRNHIESLMSMPPDFERRIRQIVGPLRVFTTLFAGLFFVNLLIDAFFRFAFGGVLADGQVTMSTAAQFIVDGSLTKFVAASLVVSLVFLIWFDLQLTKVVDAVRRPKPSFIVFDEASKKNRRDRLKKYQRRWPKLIGVVVLDVVVIIAMFFFERGLATLI